MREVRILRPYFDDRTGVLLPPGVVLPFPAPEAEALRVSGIGEVMEVTTTRRERATPPRRERRSR